MELQTQLFIFILPNIEILCIVSELSYDFETLIKSYLLSDCFFWWMFASRLLFPTSIIWELGGVELENSLKPVKHTYKVSNFFNIACALKLAFLTVPLLITVSYQSPGVSSSVFPAASWICWRQAEELLCCVTVPQVC